MYMYMDMYMYMNMYMYMCTRLRVAGEGDLFDGGGLLEGLEVIHTPLLASPQEMPVRPSACDADAGCVSCEDGASYEATPPTASSLRVCALFTECADEEHETGAPGERWTAGRDRVCASNTVCSEHQWESTQAVPGVSDRACS